MIGTVNLYLVVSNKSQDYNTAYHKYNEQVTLFSNRQILEVKPNAAFADSSTGPHVFQTIP